MATGDEEIVAKSACWNRIQNLMQIWIPAVGIEFPSAGFSDIIWTMKEDGRIGKWI